MSKVAFTMPYLRLLIKQFEEATGKSQVSEDYVLRWYSEREYMLKEYAQLLESFKRDERYIIFLEEPVEVGEIGSLNTVSDYFSKMSVVSPFANLIDKDNAYVGELTFDGLAPSFDGIDESSEKIPGITTFKTFITHNPDFDRSEEMLMAFKKLSTCLPSVAISVIGHKNDLDILEKIENLHEYYCRLKEDEDIASITNTFGPVVRENFYETDDGVIINTLISDAHMKLVVMQMHHLLFEKTREISKGLSLR